MKEQRANARSLALPRHKTYQDYRESGIGWLNEIPAHWEVRRLKYSAKLNPESLPEDTDPTLKIVYLDIGGVDGLGRIVEREQLTFASAPSRARRIVRDGDVIVSTVRTYLRSIAPISDPDPSMIVSTGFAVIRPENGLTAQYAAYALRTPYFVERVVAHSKGVSFPAINEGEMATYELALPPEREQRAIADFLDRETAKIDALVAKKERMIELLREKRAALITQAVTKGLDPTAPMKDSGIEWLGRIPAHWEIRPLKHLSGSISVGIVVNPSQYVSVEGVPFLYGSDIGEGLIRTDGARRMTNETSLRFAKSRLLAGDLVTVRVGAPGVTAVVPPELEGCNCASMLIVRRSTRFDSQWLCYAMNSRIVRWQVELVQYGAAQEQFNVSHAVDWMIPTPGVEEQRAIAGFLDREAAKIDIFIAKVYEGIERLKEYRTALISAAVTGKIDVREAA